MDVCYTLAAVPLDSDMELLSSDLQNQAPVKFLESAHGPSCFQSLNKLEQFFPTNGLMILLLLFCFSTISFGFFWGLLSIWRLRPGVPNLDPHQQNIQSPKTVLDA